MAEGVGQDQVSARDARQDAAQIDQHVRRGPEGVAADALVPGDVPEAPYRSGGDRDYAGGDIPGDGRRAIGGVCRAPCDGCALSHMVFFESSARVRVARSGSIGWVIEL